MRNVVRCVACRETFEQAVDYMEHVCNKPIDVLIAEAVARAENAVADLHELIDFAEIANETGISARFPQPNRVVRLFEVPFAIFATLSLLGLFILDRIAAKVRA
jgi:hypothetical protein